MPIARYVAWVGTSLLTLLFVVNWFFPEHAAAPAPEASNRPIIRIASMQQPPEKVVIDTSLPTIVPPSTPFEDKVADQPSPLVESYASANLPATVVNLDQKKRKIVKRKPPKAMPGQPALAGTPVVVASGNSGTNVQPTRLSFADIISGRLARNLLNLN